MEERDHPFGGWGGNIDYSAAAERLLIALSFIATKMPERPVPAVDLCIHVFDSNVRKPWSRETRRRRIREVVEVARKLLKERNQKVGGGAEILADGKGYWISKDRQVIAWYAAQRRRHALRELAAGKEIHDVAANAGQKPLFPEPPPPLRH